MAEFIFVVSAALAATGTALGVFGILASEIKPISIGLILIFGGGVFALLYVGARRAAGHAARRPPAEPTGDPCTVDGGPRQ
ncbi:MAG TPA: hypothetical protein VND64_19850 [Pirellulales bacterium]|nr:hypothetical protein [Pirellulales bacterium]